MLDYIWFDLKRKVKSPRTFFIIVLIFILSLQKIGEYNIKSKKSDNNSLYNRGEAIEKRSKNQLDSYIRYNTNVIDENIINSYKFMENIGAQMKIAIKNHDYKEYNRLSSFGNLLTSRRIVINEHKLREMSFRKQIMEIWNEVSQGIPYEDIYFEKTGKKGETHFYYKFLVEAKYNYILFRENLTPIDPYHIDSMTYIYMYLNEVLPLIIGFIIIILTFDSINEEWSRGSLKMTLTNIFSRNKYIMSKIIGGTLYTIFVAALPAAIISLGYGFYNGFVNYNYPVIYFRKGFQTLSPIPNFLEFDKGNVGYNSTIGFSLHSGIPKGEMGISNKLTFMPLYKFLLLSFILLIFAIIFYVVLNTLISSMTKSKIIGFTISIIITLVGTIVSKQWTMNKHYNLSPFSMNNPIRILNGTYNVTAMTSIIVLIGVSLLLIILNLNYYKNKDL